VESWEKEDGLKMEGREGVLGRVGAKGVVNGVWELVNIGMR